MRVIILIGQRVRSGTNFIGTTLKLHPDVTCIPPDHSLGEFNLFRSRSVKFNFNEVLSKSFGINKKSEDLDQLLKFYGVLWKDFLKQKYGLQEESVVFIKSPLIQNIDLWQKAFPDSRIAVLCRDGRDNVISSVKASNDKRRWHTKKLSLKKRINFISGRYFIAHAKDWARTAKMYLNLKEDTSLKKFRYEDLNNSKEGIAELLDFYGLHSSDEIVDLLMNAPVVGSSFGVKKDGMMKPNWEPDFDKKKFKFTGKWHRWSKLKKVVFNKIAGKELDALGYKF